MVTEDYVSFETAKLLKESGFDERCISYYVDYEPNDVKYSFLDETNSTWESRCYSAPTLQMVMKWLREVHNFYVDICPCVEEEYWNSKWNVYVSKLMNKYPFQQFIGVFDTYEQACEEAIKYCLENLI